MKINILEKIKIPGGVEVSVINHMVGVKGIKGEINKKLFDPRISIVKEDDNIIVKCSKASKYDLTKANTYIAHIKNMLKGVSNGYEARLKICSGHFPMNVSVSDNKIIIKNFLGEKVPRVTNIMGRVNVKVEGDIIIVSGCDKDNVGQTSANIENVTRITKKDRRVFMDGIFIIKKAE